LLIGIVLASLVYLALAAFLTLDGEKRAACATLQREKLSRPIVASH